MIHYLSEAGPLVWAVLLLGAAGLVAAGRYLQSPGRRQAATALGFTLTALIVAGLATVTGFQRSVGGLGQVAAEKRWIYQVGLSESLNNLVVALVLAVLVGMLLTVGVWRQAGSRAAG